MVMRFLLAIPLSLLSFSSVTFACSCFSSGGCPGLGGRTSPLFLGTVLSVKDLPGTVPSAFLSSRQARIRVDEQFGGLAPDVREVNVYTGSGGGDCGIGFKVGEVYLIDAFIGEDGIAHAGICSSTRRMDYAGVLLHVLRQQRDGKPVPSLIGQAARQDRSFDGLIGTLAPKPLANLLVRVKTGERVFEAQADADGIYAFYGLPSGKYEFAPDLPTGTTLSWFIGSDRPAIPFELHERACQMHDMEVFASGAIQGRILDASGKPLASAFAYIVPANEKVLPKQGKLYWEYQGKQDFFKFVHIPPGDYLIVVNPDDSRDPKFPYRRTFFPGVHDRASAATITIRGGELIKDADIQLEQQFAARHVTVRVTWADGRLIRGFVLVTAKGSSNPDAMSNARQPNLKASTVDLSILPNEPYDVEAELTCRYADEQSVGPGAKLKSNKIRLAPGDDQGELLLTIPATSCPEVPGKKLLTDQLR
jgi:hypothetical protein